jgi:hypothetical protein
MICCLLPSDWGAHQAASGHDHDAKAKRCTMRVRSRSITESGMNRLAILLVALVALAFGAPSAFAQSTGSFSAAISNVAIIPATVCNATSPGTCTGTNFLQLNIKTSGGSGTSLLLGGSLETSILTDTGTAGGGGKVRASAEHFEVQPRPGSARPMAWLAPERRIRAKSSLGSGSWASVTSHQRGLATTGREAALACSREVLKFVYGYQSTA